MTSSGRTDSITSTVTLSGIKDIKLSWNAVNVFGTGSSRPKLNVVGAMTSCMKKNQFVPKQILNDVHGSVQNGQLLALMGASGAGKTTLLNVLTGRNLKHVVVDGNVLVNGQNIGSAIRNISAYVQQQDLFIGTLKVKEHLLFQARLRMGKSCSRSQQLQRVEEVLTELCLVKCSDTMIGIPGRIKGISGGEKKRLAFASEILTNPPLFFCDEPTSGLDSFMAQQIVGVLRDIARQGRAVICTIHQPSSHVFTFFDRLCLLSEGRVAYFGSLDEAPNFFNKIGLPCPVNYNRADHYVHSLAVVPGKETECRKRIKLVCDAYNAEYAFQNDKSSSERANIHDANEYEWNQFVSTKSSYKSSWSQQFGALMWRGWLGAIREPMLVKVRLMQSTVISALLGFFYFQTELCCSTIQNINGILFLIVSALTFPYLFGSISVFCDDIPVLIRETSSKLYRVDVYYLTKILTELPQYILYPIVFTTIIYWLVGLQPSVIAFLIALGASVLTANVATSVGYLVSTVAGNLSMANTIAPLFCVPFILFSGFYLNQASVPVYFSWLQYISYIKYSFEVFLVNEWGHTEDIPTCGLPANSTVCFANGREVLEMYGFEQSNLMVSLVILLSMVVGIRGLSFLFLWARTSQRN